MKYTQLGEYSISRVGLGTVQFGMDYGISNKTGKVGFSDVVDIFRTAAEQGLNFIDTAPVYGDSEETIGKAVAELGGGDELVICTKLDLPPKVETASDDEIVSVVKSRVARSLKALRLRCIPVYLLHRPADLSFRDGLIWNCLLEERAAGRIAHLGVSVDGSSTADALTCIDTPEVDALQIPLNALDMRWHKAGVIEAAERKGTAVITRSSYLKGLLAMDVEEVPAFLHEALPHKRFFAELASDLGITSVQLVLRYVLSLPGITTTIIGVDTAAQFRENLDIYNSGPLPDEVIARIQAQVDDVSDLVLVPSMWNEHMELEKYDRDAL